jgi:hypothetical protein
VQPPQSLRLLCDWKQLAAFAATDRHAPAPCEPGWGVHV